jgi:hypothetical protein
MSAKNVRRLIYFFPPLLVVVGSGIQGSEVTGIKVLSSFFSSYMRNARKGIIFD